MAAKPLTKAQLWETARAYNRFKGKRLAACRALGIKQATFDSRIRKAKAQLPKGALKQFDEALGRAQMRPALVAEAVHAVQQHGNVTAAARALGIPRATLEKRYFRSETTDDWKPAGRSKATRARPLPLPKGNQITRYLLTCAQSGTKLHEPTWNALLTFSETVKARIMVSSFTYSHRQEGSAKRGTSGGDLGLEWYDPRLESHFIDEMVALAPNLVWNGHVNILPTASDPLSGLDSYNGRASSVFPHAKISMRSVPTMPGSAAKFQYTTGCVTQLNYLQKKAGQKAEFHHSFGALLVEVNSAGEWWPRQISVDGRGRIYDVDHMADGTPSVGAKAVVFGDAHVAHMTKERMDEMLQLVRATRPDYIVLHDVLDFESRGHHNRRDPHKMFSLHAKRRENVAMEVGQVGEFLAAFSALGRVVVVNSNHDRHLERWLKEADWRTDPVNAQFYIEAQRAYLGAINAGEKFNALKWAVRHINPVKGVRFLDPGESFVVCRDASGGIELGLHGDAGPGGSRGSIRNLSRLGRKVVIGHSHGAGIFDGAYQVGVSAPVDAFDYAAGAPGNWSHTDCIIHPNGKRQLVTWWKGKWRA